MASRRGLLLGAVQAFGAVLIGWVPRRSTAAEAAKPAGGEVFRLAWFPARPASADIRNQAAQIRASGGRWLGAFVSEEDAGPAYVLAALPDLAASEACPAGAHWTFLRRVDL